MSQDATRNIKKEISQKASMANKRLKRLERNNLTDLPVYKNWYDDGAVKFSVKNKSYNELQQELSRVNSFINNKTSLVRGANSYMKDVAQKVGLKYTSVKSLSKDLKAFFEVSSKVEQYLRATENSASAIGYHKIWEVVNQYVQTQVEDLGSVYDSLDGIDKLLDELLVSQAFEKSTEILRKKVTDNEFWNSL